MKALRNNIPIILLILFELIVGILLFVNPEGFTAAAITCFGIVLLAIGVIYLIRFLREKNQYPTLVLALVSLVIGFICTFLTSLVMGLFAVVAVIYGVILIVSGVYKFKAHRDAKRLGLPTIPLALISAILSIILGLVIVVNPFTTTKVLWSFAGISLIVEAVVDFCSMIFGRS